MNANRFRIQPRLRLSSNRYTSISIPICAWQIICKNFNCLRSYEHNDMAISVLLLMIHTGNNSTVICISNWLQVIIHLRDIFIFYERRVYGWILDMWLQHNSGYKVICLIRDIYPWVIQFTWYAQILSIFIYLYFFVSDKPVLCSQLQW